MRNASPGVKEAGSTPPGGSIGVFAQPGQVHYPPREVCVGVSSEHSPLGSDQR